MPALTDVLHLVVVVAGVAVGAWALIAMRVRLPRGRFVAFGAASAGALFGCAALGGDVGLIPPTAWFAAIMALMATIVAAGLRLNRAPAAWK